MKKIFTVLLVLVFVMTGFTGAIFAHGAQSKMGPGGQSFYNRDRDDVGVGYNRIDLSDEQINQIADLRNEFYNDTEELRDQLRDLNRQLRDLEFRGASNAEIGKTEDQIEKVLTQLDEKRINNQEKIESVLTEEQLNLIEENRLNYEERFQNRFNNDFGPGFRMNYGRNGYSDFDDFHYGMMGGMMGGAFMGGRYDSFGTPGAYNGREFGYGAGWCH